MREKAFQRLAFEAKLNEYCDKWAKEELAEYLFDADRCLSAVGKKLQVLPLEAARVFIGGVKPPYKYMALRNCWGGPCRAGVDLCIYLQKPVVFFDTFSIRHEIRCVFPLS